MRTLWLAIFLATSFSAIAQLPNTNVYLFDMKQYTDSLYTFRNPQFLTGFNLYGYNNQPQFFNNDEIYLTVQSPSGGEQTDIYSLNIATKTITQVTASADSEYSPTPMPDGEHFTVVRVEADGNNTQRLWKLPIDRSNNGTPIFSTTKDIGYHFWINDNEVLLFIVGEPHALAIGELSTGKINYITSSIGRCFQRLPNGNVAYIQKISEGTWQIKELDVYTQKSRSIIYTLPGSEDFVILKDGTILMAQGNRLFKYNKAIDKQWLEIANFQEYGISTITRLSVSDDNKIALVAN